MLSALLKVRLLSFLNQMSGAGKTDKQGRPRKRGKGGVALLLILFAYCFGIYGFMFVQFFNAYGSFCLNGSAEAAAVFYGLAALIALVLSFMGSVFSTQSQVFNAQDNELLLSMPIKPRHILLSRLLFVIALNLLFSLLVMVPCAISAFSVGTASVTLIVTLLLAALLIPLLSTALSCLFGWLISLLTARVQNKGILNTVFSILFLIIFFVVYYRFQRIMIQGENSPDQIAGMIPGLITAFKSYLVPFYWIGQAISAPTVVNTLLTLSITVLPFVLACVLISRSFIKLTTTKVGAKKRHYEKKELRVSSVRWALIKRELKHFVSSSVYMMNCGLGLLMLLAASVFLLFQRNTVIGFVNQLGFDSGMITLLAALIVCFMGFMNDMTAPSVSLEGKSLWIAQCLPMDMSQVLFAKVDMQLLLCGPVLLIASAACAITIRSNLVFTVLLVLLPQLMNAMNAMLGVIFNLAMPKFQWPSETVPVKQGAPVILVMLCNMAYIMSFGALYLLVLQSFMSPLAFLLGFTAISLILSAVMWIYLKGKGARKFATIG